MVINRACSALRSLFSIKNGIEKFVGYRTKKYDWVKYLLLFTMPDTVVKKKNNSYLEFRNYFASKLKATHQKHIRYIKNSAQRNVAHAKFIPNWCKIYSLDLYCKCVWYAFPMQYFKLIGVPVCVYDVWDYVLYQTVYTLQLSYHTRGAIKSL